MYCRIIRKTFYESNNFNTLYLTNPMLITETLYKIAKLNYLPNDVMITVLWRIDQMCTRPNVFSHNQSCLMMEIKRISYIAIIFYKKQFLPFKVVSNTPFSSFWTSISRSRPKNLRHYPKPTLSTQSKSKSSYRVVDVRFVIIINETTRRTASTKTKKWQ